MVSSSIPRPMLDAALDYARTGIPVFPVHWIENNKCSCGNPACNSPGKHPLIKRWQVLATTDERQIRAWWAKWPSASIGMPTGDPSGRVVLDFDAKKGGLETLAAYEKQDGELRTMKVATPGGGFHFHFWSRGLDIRCSAGEIGPGFDVRGNGGFAILPPSAGPNGKFYELVTTNEVRDLPAPMEKLLLKFEGSRSSRTSTRADGEKQKEGGRNDYLTSVAGAMRRQGMSTDEMLAALWQINLSRCDPPLEGAEVRQIATSVGRYEPGAPNAKIPHDLNEEKVDTIPGRYPITDVSNAERLIAQFGDEIVYASDRGVWCVWNGIVWIVDDTLGVAKRMKKIARGMYLEAGRETDDDARKALVKWAQKSESQRTQLNSIDAAKDLAEHRGFACRFDVDPLKFTFTNGTVSLQKEVKTSCLSGLAPILPEKRITSPR